jgi:hypothetical protein
MVRMSNPGDTAQSPAYAGGPMGASRSASLGERAAEPGSRGAHELRASGAWAGAGGRWLIWPLRAALWAVLLVIAFRGVTTIVLGNGVASLGAAAPSLSTAPSPFPVSVAEAYALEFAQVYLSFNPATQAQREQQLAAFVPASLAAADPDLGWNGSGQAHLQSAQVAGITVQGPRNAVVSILATVGGQLMELGVPIYAEGQGVVVSGQPAWLPAPRVISPPSPAAVSSDPVAQSELMNQLPAFFQAYASGDSAALNRFLVPGFSLTGMNGGVAFDSITGVVVPRGGSTRQITVTVVWQVLNQGNPTTAKLTMAYRVSVVALQSGKWYVKGISASTEAVGGQ